LKPTDEARYELLQSSRGINHLLGAIEHIRRVVLSGHAVSDVPDWLLPKGVWKDVFGIDARAGALKKEATKLKALKLLAEQTEADKEAARRDLAAIPDKEKLDRLLRYENSNRHQAQRLEERLEQLQERRRRKDAKTGLETNGDPESRKKT